MTQPTNEHINLIQNDRVKLPISLDVAKMQKEIQELNLEPFVYYNVITLRSPAHLVDTTLPFPPPAQDYADGSWTDWLNTPQLKQCPYLLSIIENFQAHTNVTLVRLLRLASGSVVDEHTDPTLGLEIHKSVIRLTIPIFSDDFVEFYLNRSLVPMKPGECWYLRLTDPHKIIHKGKQERINMTIDVTPNDWVKDMIANRT